MNKRIANRISEKNKQVFAGLLTIFILGILFWTNFIYIQNKPTERNFLVPWLAVKNYIKIGVDPYSDVAAKTAQQAFYGNKFTDNQDPLFFYDQPIISSFIYIPFAFIDDYKIARVGWMLFLEICLIISAWFGMTLFGRKINKIDKYILFFISLFGVQAIIPLLEGNIIIFIYFLLFAGLFFINRGLDEFAGVAFVLVIIIKISLWLPIILVIYWASKRRRWRILTGMGLTSGFLIFGSFALFPGWLIPFAKSLIHQLQFLPFQSSFLILPKIWPKIGMQVAGFTTITTLIILFVEWRALKDNGERWFLWTISLTFILFPILGTPYSIGDKLVLWISIIFSISFIVERIKDRTKQLIIASLFLTIFSFGWVFELFGKNLLRNPEFHILLFFSPSFILLIILYWIRWRAIQQSLLKMDNFQNDK